MMDLYSLCDSQGLCKISGRLRPRWRGRWSSEAPRPSQRGANENTPQMRMTITLPKLVCYFRNMSTIWIISMIQKTFMRIWHTGPCILPVFSIPTASVRTQKVTIRILKRLTNVAYKHVIGGMAQFLHRHRMEASSGWSCGKHTT